MKYLFVSYARQDAKRVLPIVEAVSQEFRRRASRVDVWIDIKDLLPGERWEPAIRKALRESIGLLVFVSPAAMKESAWVSLAMAAAEVPALFIIPVILKPTPDLPVVLTKLQPIDLSVRRAQSNRRQTAKQIVDLTEAHLKIKAAPTMAKIFGPKAYRSWIHSENQKITALSLPEREAIAWGRNSPISSGDFDVFNA